MGFQDQMTLEGPRRWSNFVKFWRIYDKYCKNLHEPYHTFLSWVIQSTNLGDLNVWKGLGNFNISLLYLHAQHVWIEEMTAVVRRRPRGTIAVIPKRENTRGWSVVFGDGRAVISSFRCDWVWVWVDQEGTVNWITHMNRQWKSHQLHSPVLKRN